MNPADLKIEFSELNLVQKLGQSLGFYNPSVTITFTAKDVISGIDHFDWTYTPESGAAVTKEIAVNVNAQTKVATATLTLPADQAEQMHGKISFTATDKASNEIGKTDDYVFIVDTIAPELSVKYQGEEPYTAQEDTYNGAHFFNSDVVVELTITETNFYAEDVIVKVSKDSAAPTVVIPSWNNKVGTFTLAGDGDYVVYVTYTDKANNKMADYASETITVDKTPPVVKIDYVHNGDVQKTVFTVTEHNFRASDVVITGTMKDITGTDVALTSTQLTTILNNATWTKAGDVYIYEYDQYVNGIYNLKMDYKDIAGWDATQEVEDEFIIDHDAPSEPTIEYITAPWETFLTPDQMRERANQYRAEADTVNGVINKMDSLLQQLQSEWEGAASESYAARYQELKPGFMKAEELIREIAAALDSTAKIVEETDTSIANQFRG